MYFNCEVFNNCEKVEEVLYRIYCVNIRDMSGITMGSVSRLNRGEEGRRVFCLSYDKKRYY